MSTHIAQDIHPLGGPIEDFMKGAQQAVQKVVGEGQKVVQAAMKEGQKAIDFAQNVVKDPIGTVVQKLTFQTAYTSPVIYTGAELVADLNAPPNPNSKSKRIGQQIRPTFLLETPFGKFNYAPYGQATATEWVQNQNKLKFQLVAVVAGLVGAGFLLGRVGSRK